jgi:Lon protease-like protein
MPAFAYRKPRDLPDSIPVFPLDGALLLPRSVLPLNIFEPRYLNMVDDVLGGKRLIGMIQTRPGADVGERPELAGVGCVGRLTSFSETLDGRYLITLTGVCRFAPVEELDGGTPYRQVRASYDRFAADLTVPALPTGFDRAELLSVLRAFLVSNDLAADWSSVENAPPETLINSLCMVCPFDAAEKQALLEAPTIDDRRETLLTLMRMRAVGPDGGVA